MRILATLTTFLLVCGIALSTTIYVPDDYPTIQGAIDKSANGDQIIVRQGTYVENINFLGKTIRVISQAGPSLTVIDGNQNGSVVTFDSWEGAGTRIEGFSLTNGFAIQGGGINCWYSSPTVTGNVLSNNVADVHGGGIFCADSSATITGNTISHNQADFYGGGIYCYAGAYPTVAGNVISHNQADGSGGGVYCYNLSSPTIIDNTVSGNSCYESGGGIFCDCDATIAGNIISDNFSKRDGGGVGCYNNASPSITGNIFKNNETYDNGGGIGGAGCMMTVKNNILVGNRARYHGGGVAFRASALATLTNNTIADNSSDYEGGGIYCNGESNLTVTNTILWNNSAPEGTEIWVGRSGHPSSLTIGYSDVDGGQASVYVESGCTLNVGEGMINADPLFVDPAGGDYHLFFLSPCRNAGDADVPGLPSEDIEGDPRVALNGVDMGADEYYFHLYHMGEVIPGSPIDVKVIGYPAAPVLLAFGSGIQDPPYATQHGDFWLDWPPLWLGNVGTVPGDGVKVHSTTVPIGWASGSEHPLQALVGPWGGPWTRLTNLLVLKVD